MKRDLNRRIMALPVRAKLAFAWRLFRAPRVPASARAVLPGVLVYLASPIDVIPDFIPLLGHVDDLLVLFVGFEIVLWLTPRHVIQDLLREFE